MEVIKIALQYLIRIMQWIIIAKALFSWFPNVQSSKIYDILDELTEPLEMPIRRVLSRFNTGVIDFSPIVAIMVLMLINNLISRFL